MDRMGLWDMSNDFNHDECWSKHKDILLKDFWQGRAHEGRYVIIGSRLLQKTHGIDIVLQSKNDTTDITMDTKHIKGQYSAFWFEDESCPKRNTLGWARKPINESAEYIPYCFWPEAQKYGCKICRNDCFQCEVLFEHCIMYLLHYAELYEWFRANRHRFPLDTNANRKTINKTTGRIVPIHIYREEIGLIIKHIIINNKDKRQPIRGQGKEVSV